MRAFTFNPLQVGFYALLALNIGLWTYSKDLQAEWTNVPPVANSATVKLFALGDAQLAYRGLGLMLQNLGNSGGRRTALTKYDYQNLKEWLFLGTELDNRSYFIPFLAALYFGAVPDSAKLPPLIEYLEFAGTRPGTGNWRWLAQAVYLARFQMKDLNEAYRLAVRLSSLDDPSLPHWARQMPAFILTAKGDKQAAYNFLTGILEAQDAPLPPQEVNAIKYYLCERVMEPEKTRSSPLCEGINASNTGN